MNSISDRVEGNSRQQALDTDSATHDRVIVMTRFPEPGKTKTRLIPALGAELATALHCVLVRQTLQSVVRLTQHGRCSPEVRFAGGSSDRMQELFGSEANYVPQVGSDLGERISSAFAIAFAEGAQRVVVIGTDCPDLEPAILQQAFELLLQADVVIGPAHDGGYYLLGMRRQHAQLFREIDWGTELVMKQTLEKSSRLRLRVELLASLSDVDYPEDLIACRRRPDVFRGILPESKAGLLSIIIPVFNEERTIAETLSPLLNLDDVEVLVVDGGSTDQTRQICEAQGVRVVPCQAGRGRQMNAGAALAKGELLLFLHADTRLPPEFLPMVWQNLKPVHAGGAFQLRIDASDWKLRIVEIMANLRSRWLQLPYGDQAIFVRADTFYYMGGFRNWPLMEDFEFCRRLRKFGRIVQLPASVLTSARRWQRLGIIRTTLINQLCVLAYSLGVPTDRIARWYQRSRAIWNISRNATDQSELDSAADGNRRGNHH